MPADWSPPPDLYRDISLRMAELETPAPSWLQKWSLRDGALLVATILVCIGAIVSVPNFLYDLHAHKITYALGVLATWRYGAC